MKDSLGGRALVAVVSAITFAGVIRQARRYSFKVIHFVFPFYVVVTLLWSYPIGDRFFILFLPLFAAGFWFESKHILAMAQSSFPRYRPAGQRIAGAVFSLMLFALAGGIALNYLGPMRSRIAQESENRALLLQDLLGAYDWIGRNTSPGARLIAYEDASLYLYTGRQAIVPIEFTMDEFYEPGRLPEAVQHMMDVPRAIGAGYWLFTDDDYRFAWPHAQRSAQVQMARIESKLPLVYRSIDGRVRVRSLDSLQHVSSQLSGLGDPIPLGR
jgi:hypothetical protein